MRVRCTRPEVIVSLPSSAISNSERSSEINSFRRKTIWYVESSAHLRNYQDKPQITLFPAIKHRSTIKAFTTTIPQVLFISICTTIPPIKIFLHRLMATTIQFGEDSMLKTMRNEQDDLGPLYIKPIFQ